MKKIILLSAVFLFSLFIIPEDIFADGIIIPVPPVCESGMCEPNPKPLSQLEIRYHDVDVTIIDQVAKTHIDQVFYNPNDWTVEGTYMFPIPIGVAISDFRLWIDGNPVQGEVLDAEEARSTYENIVRQMKDPALLEYTDQGSIKAKIYPIQPKEDRRIEMEYYQVIPSENGLVRYIYPLNTEKFSTKPLDKVRVSIEINESSPIRAVYSPSHPVDISRNGQRQLSVSYEEFNVTPEMDFALYYSIGDNEAFHLISYCEPSGEVPTSGFFTLLLAPRPNAGMNPLAKDVLVVIDRSGSMEGEKFLQAQNALKYILEHLNSKDRFNLISFSTDIRVYAPEMKSVDSVNDAISWMNRLSAAGSTDINRALLEAAAIGDQEKPTYIIFLTDGLPTEGVVEAGSIIANMENAASSNVKIFAFGVGYDVDTFLLDTLAANHHGSATYVIPGEQIDEVVSGFYAKISKPVLTNITLDFGDINVYDLYPSPLPDMFEGTQILVVGRYQEGGITDVVVKGNYNQEEQTFIYREQHFMDESFPQQEDSDNYAFIPRLWATRKVGYLLNQIRLNGPNQEVIDQIVKLSIRYGIVTPYTSYLVTEPLPLGSIEQERIVEEQIGEQLAIQSAPTYGRQAVEKAIEQGDLENSTLASFPQKQDTAGLKIVGSRTFIFQDGIWIDTAFDPDTMNTIKVAFLSDDYFALVNARTNLAKAFGIGEKVIVVSEGIVYEVVGESESVESIEIPGKVETNELENHSENEDRLDDRDYLNDEDVVQVGDNNRDGNQISVGDRTGMDAIVIHDVAGIDSSKLPEAEIKNLLLLIIILFSSLLIVVVWNLWYKRRRKAP